MSRPMTRCYARGCNGAERLAEPVTILRGADRTPVTLTALRCPRCGDVATTPEERAKLSAPATGASSTAPVQSPAA